MMTRSIGVLLYALFSLAVHAQFDPRGRIHIAIGAPDSNDRLKTFVEPEGCFSPGVGSYGIYFMATDPATGKLVAPTMPGVKVDYGLAPGGLPLPWSRWNAGPVTLRTQLAHAVHGKTDHVVLSKVELTNTDSQPLKTTLVVAVRPLGPAGFAIPSIQVGTRDIRVQERLAVGSYQPTEKSLALSTDTIGAAAAEGRIKVQDEDQEATSDIGDCSAALAFDVQLKSGESKTLNFICPVMNGRRVLPHQWDGVSPWAQFDLAPYNPAEGSKPQFDHGPCYVAMDFDELWQATEQTWKDLVARPAISLPDPRWSDALSAITAHVALAMNDGAPDVAVLNYNVYNRDGVYVTSILHKAGRLDLAEKCIDYFLSRPFNGRVQPEADNPGQILWIIGEHWQFSRDLKWLERIYPSVRKLAAMIRYYRTTPPPHYVWDASLDFGHALPKEQRKLLKPGACDGHHPEYTQAFDIAGLRAAAACAIALDRREDADAFSRLAADLFKTYDDAFSKDLAKEYGSYCVLWPCRLYPLTSTGPGADMKAVERFAKIGPQKPTSWRYFPLARAHQALLAGNRDTAHKTIDTHLAHEQMTAGHTWKAGEPARGFFAFDEGGKSGAGGWKDKNGKPLLRTTWNGDVAMPHGWAIAELHLLIRDAIVYEEEGRLVLLAGIPAEWFKHPLSIQNLPTHYGPLNLTWTPNTEGGTAKPGGATPPGGFVVRTPERDVIIESGKQ